MFMLMSLWRIKSYQQYTPQLKLRACPMWLQALGVVSSLLGAALCVCL
jgi:hypothetical protein